MGILLQKVYLDGVGEPLIHPFFLYHVISMQMDAIEFIRVFKIKNGTNIELFEMCFFFHFFSLNIEFFSIKRSIISIIKKDEHCSYKPF